MNIGFWIFTVAIVSYLIIRFFPFEYFELSRDLQRKMDLRLCREIANKRSLENQKLIQLDREVFRKYAEEEQRLWDLQGSNEVTEELTLEIQKHLDKYLDEMLEMKELLEFRSNMSRSGVSVERSPIVSAGKSSSSKASGSSSSKTDIPRSKANLTSTTIRFYFSLVVSMAILAASLTVILKGSYTDSTEKWAYGAIGTISGYWLKA